MGRMRLPPPLRRYSPISVIASTPETVSRPNSRSMAERSPRSNSKISFPLMPACALNWFVPKSEASTVESKKFLIRSVIRELRINTEILATKERDDFLQRVTILASAPHQFSLTRCFHLLLGILDDLYDLARLLDGDALLHGDLLFYCAPGGGLHGTVCQSFERDTALHVFLLKGFGNSFQFVFIGGMQVDSVLALESDVRLRVFEIEASMNFLQCLLH